VFVQPDEKTAESEVRQLARELRALSEKIDALTNGNGSVESEVLEDRR